MIDLEKLKKNYKLAKENSTLVNSLSHLEIYNLKFDSKGNIVLPKLEDDSDDAKRDFELQLLKQVAESGDRVTPKINVDLDGSYEGNSFMTDFEKIVPIPSNSKTVPKDILYKIASEDELRPILNGVYYNNGFIYATDAHKLVKIKKTTTKILRAKQ